MKPYSCYPASRTRFAPSNTRFTNPGFSQVRNGGFKNHLVSTVPSANILRKEGGFDIQLAIPGLGKDQVKIEFHENQITISGIATDQENKPKMVRKEFNFSGFKRSFQLHKNADANAISASFNQGLLTIHIPDMEKKTTKINIQ
jgi:HSP20 family protein